MRRRVTFLLFFSKYLSSFANLNIILPVCEENQFLLSQKKLVLDKHLEEDHWIDKLAYMAEVFEHMTQLNIRI